MKKNPYQGKSTWKKVWYFIWEDDSVLSWIVNIVIAFVLIKFLIYPGLGLLFGTTHPVVAVVSGSMEHKTTPHCLQGNAYTCSMFNPDAYEMCGFTFEERKRVDFDFFWETCGDNYREYNINKLMFEEFPFKNGFNTGDIIVLFGRDAADIALGDVIVFAGDRPDPIIHRVIKKVEFDGDFYFTTRGDHNRAILAIEQNIHEDRLVGRAVFRIPYLGYIKIWFIQLLELLHLDFVVRMFS